MANCIKCRKSVSCGCSLIDGLCTSCYSEKNNSSSPQMKVTYNNVINPNPPQPNTEYDNILNIKNISKVEKLRRINDILEKAKENYVNSK